MRSFSLKRVRSPSLNIFGVWLGIFLHMITNVLDCSNLPGITWLVIVIVTVLLPSFIILKKRTLAQNPVGKKIPLQVHFCH